MKTRLIAILAAAIVCAPAIAQNVEPGEWQLTSTTISSDLPKPEVDTEKVCLTKEDVDDQNRLMGELAPGCKRTMGKKSGDSLSWTDSCPQAGVSGSGTMRWTRTTVELDITLVAPDKTKIRTKISGKRLGPCKK